MKNNSGKKADAVGALLLLAGAAVFAYGYYVLLSRIGWIARDPEGWLALSDVTGAPFAVQGHTGLSLAYAYALHGVFLLLGTGETSALMLQLVFEIAGLALCTAGVALLFGVCAAGVLCLLAAVLHLRFIDFSAGLFTLGTLRMTFFLASVVFFLAALALKGALSSVKKKNAEADDTAEGADKAARGKYDAAFDAEKKAAVLDRKSVV